MSVFNTTLIVFEHIMEEMHPFVVNLVLLSLNIYEYFFIHLLPIFLWGSYISILSISNVGNEQLAELHYGEILILPLCLAFPPSPFAWGTFTSETWKPHHICSTVHCRYTGLGLAVVIFFPSQTFGNHSSMTMPDRKEHLKMQPISKSVSF